MQKISPFLWFNDRAEEAVGFYTSLFHDAKITKTLFYPENSKRRHAGQRDGLVVRARGPGVPRTDGGP